jgi:RNA polymerase sigma-70 factor (ECF subfamily)
MDQDSIAAGTEPRDLDDVWRDDRRHLLGLATRMLGDAAEAEDVVQDAFGRLARVELSEILDVRGWLAVVVRRLCLDRIKSARSRHELVGGPSEGDLPEADGEPDPADRVTLDEQVQLALAVVLDRLSPAERTSFVLHDVFQYSFEDVATIVGRSSAACRQLASRARQTLGAETAAGRFPVETAIQRRVSERFIKACDGGDLDDLLTLLDPSVSGSGDVAAADVVGANEVAPQLLYYLGPPASPTLVHIPVGDRVGIVAIHGHRVAALVLLTVVDDLIVHVHALAGAGPRAAVAAALGLK